MSENEDEMKPCPFCGSEGELDMSCGVTQAYCSNEDCGNMGFVFNGIKAVYLDDILKHWNTQEARSKLDKAEKRVKELETFIIAYKTAILEGLDDEDEIAEVNAFCKLKGNET